MDASSQPSLAPPRRSPGPTSPSSESLRRGRSLGAASLPPLASPPAARFPPPGPPAPIPTVPPPQSFHDIPSGPKFSPFPGSRAPSRAPTGGSELPGSRLSWPFSLQVAVARIGAYSDLSLARVTASAPLCTSAGRVDQAGASELGFFDSESLRDPSGLVPNHHSLRYHASFTCA
jgi:hypothetical protein